MQCRLADNHAHQRNGFTQISKRCIAIVGQPRQYWTGMSFYPMGLPVSTEGTGPQVTLALLQMTPPANTGRADAKAIGCFAMRCAVRDRGQNAFSKIYGKSFRHICRPPTGR